MEALNGTLQNASSSPVELEYRFLQPVWNLFLGYDHYYINTIFFYQVVYFVSLLPWMMLDLYGKKSWRDKYKIQPEKEVKMEHMWRMIVYTLWNHTVIILPVGLAQWVYAPGERIDTLPVLAPTVWQFVWQPFAALAILDAEYFAWHALHHKVRWLYRHVHALHHQYSSPNSWSTHYLHPWELISTGVFSTTSPWVIGCHPLTEVMYQIIAVNFSIQVHSGYDMPFMLHRWFPYWGGTPFHDMHHQKPLTNFAPFYTYLDWLCGSYCPGKLAGGVKPPALIEWEKGDKEKRFAARQAKLESEETLKSKVC